MATTSAKSTDIFSEAEASPVRAAAEATRFSWRAVESEDYKRYIANLRGIECPEQTIRDIITADVDKLFAPRFAALREPEKENKWWKQNYAWGRARDKEKEKQYKALSDERDALLKELLAIDPKKERDKDNWWAEQRDQQLSFLPEDKRELARAAQEKFDEERSEIYRKAEGYIDEETQGDLKKVRKKMLAEMGKFMSPEEIFEYDLRTSDTASNLKNELTTLKPTEEEFRAIFKAKRDQEDAPATDESTKRDADYWTKRREAEKGVDAKLKELLGDDRYTEYKRSGDWSYRQLAQMSEFLGFEPSAAGKVYDMKAVVEDQSRKIQRDKALTPEARNDALRAMRAETEKSIVELIGERGFKAYKRQGGYWVNNIAPRPFNLSRPGQ
ncbi:MAG TPA: hypothetical protein VI454_04005 [Verrucomicrobiae bacterium]